MERSTAALAATEPHAVLLKKLADHSAHVAVLGMGYVGLPLAVAFAEAGFVVTGLDIDAGKLAALQRGESYIEDIAAARVQARLSVAQEVASPSPPVQKSVAVPSTSARSTLRALPRSRRRAPPASPG